MKRILFIGQAPGKGSDGLPPFAGRTKRMLAHYAGTTVEKIDEVFEFVNVFEKWPGKRGEGDNFPMTAAKRRARRTALGGRFVWFAGMAVAKAFGYSGNEMLVRYSALDPFGGKYTFLIFPHPSGLNRWWNAPENRRKVAALLRQTAHVQGIEERRRVPRRQEKLDF